MNNPSSLQSAISHHQAGNTEEAAKIYRQILDDDPNEVNALRLLGILAASAGDLTRAEELVSKAVVLQPNFSEAHGTLGLILGEQGDILESIAAYGRALRLNPNLVDAHFGLGLVLRRKGEINKAIASLEKVININPSHVMAFENLGIMLNAKGNIDGAIRCYREICRLQPDNSRAYIRLAEVIQNVQFKTYDDSLKNDLLKCFSIKGMPYSHLGVPCSSLLKLDSQFQILLSETLSSGDELSGEYFSDKNVAILSDALFLKLLQQCTIPDEEIERFLTKVRALVLSLAIENDNAVTGPESAMLTFICALSTQCFFNEYLYIETEDESRNLEKLRKALDSIPHELAEKRKILIAIYGCYSPMYELNDAEKIRDLYSQSKDPDFYRCIEDQISNPLIELEIRSHINSLVTSKDEITESVQSQYQENPFPRWKSCNIRQPGDMKKEIRELFPRIDISANINCEKPEILIAGCGTGLQAINCSHTYRNARITAVDLSLTSLAYAIRKTRELGIDNIHYVHANILELGKLEKQYDLIECFGVLHHLSRPLEGWKVLTGLLKEGGLMMLGLYSEIARDAVVACRELIASRDYPPTIEGIRRCRRELFEMRDVDVIKRITSPRASFWTTSEVRDLIFHEMECRYSIPEIAETIDLLGLEFIGFQHHSAATHSNYLNSFPDDPDALSLKNWHEYEKANPRTFSNTYKFWLKKTAVQQG